MRPGERKRCEACGAEMVGAVHYRTGTVAPIALAAEEKGNIVVFNAETPLGPRPTEIRYAIVPQGDGLGGPSPVRAWLEEVGVPLRLNHFANCPEADRFHRSGRS